MFLVMVDRQAQQDSKTPLNIKGEIPIDRSDNLDLRLFGNGKLFELIENSFLLKIYK